MGIVEIKNWRKSWREYWRKKGGRRDRRGGKLGEVGDWMNNIAMWRWVLKGGFLTGKTTRDCF